MKFTGLPLSTKSKFIKKIGKLKVKAAKKVNKAKKKIVPQGDLDGDLRNPNY